MCGEKFLEIFLKNIFLKKNDDICFLCKKSCNFFLQKMMTEFFKKKKSQNGAPRRGLSNAPGLEPFGALLAEESI